MNRRLVLVTLVLVAPMFGQSPSVSVKQAQSPPFACELLIDYKPDDPKQQSFFLDSSAPGADLSNYTLYVVMDDNTPDVRACDKSREYIDRGRTADAKHPSSACVIPGNDSATCPVAGQFRASGFGEFFIPILKPLRSDVKYLVVITGLGDKGSTTIPVSFTSSIGSPDQKKLTSEIMITATVALATKDGQAVSIERATAKGLTQSSEKLSGHIVKAESPQGIVIDLDKHLPTGKDSQLTVRGLTDYYGVAVESKGKITIKGAPANASDAFITTSFSVNAGVHSTPAFSATGAVAPWHPAARALIIQDPGIRFDPSANFDVGSASTQTKNSLILPAPFSMPFYIGLPSLKPPRSAYDEAQEIPTEGLHPSAVNLSFGPRLEVDTKYGGVNALGQVRSEIYVYRLTQPASMKQATFASGNPAIRDLLELPVKGFAIAPYVEGDGGGRVTSTVVTVGKTSADVPTYGIGRIYLGIYGTAQLGVVSLSLDTSWVDILSPETVAYTTKTVAYLVQVSGWQPNTTAGMTFNFDQAKHYAFSLTYQNGRSAPNWQYLNKVAAGLKVTY